MHKADVLQSKMSWVKATEANKSTVNTNLLLHLSWLDISEWSSGAWNWVKGMAVGSNLSEHTLLFHIKWVQGRPIFCSYFHFFIVRLFRMPTVALLDPLTSTQCSSVNLIIDSFSALWALHGGAPIGWRAWCEIREIEEKGQQDVGFELLTGHSIESYLVEQYGDSTVKSQDAGIPSKHIPSTWQNPPRSRFAIFWCG